MKLELSVDELKKLVNKEAKVCRCNEVDSTRELEFSSKVSEVVLTESKSCIICGCTEFRKETYDDLMWKNTKYKEDDYYCKECGFMNYQYTKIRKEE